MRNFIFTSSSFLPGHPDKLCDRISDAIVDAYLTLDPNTRVVAECAIASDIVFVVCHASRALAVDHAMVARDVIREVGYRAPALDPDRVAVMINLGTLDTPPSDESAIAVSNNATLFGYACRQTRDFMPAPIALAHGIAQALWRGGPGAPSVGPDGQVQVTLEYRDRRPHRLTGVTLLAAVAADGPPLAQAILAAAADLDIVPCADTVRIDINPAGVRPAGGPRLHPGLTGRKLSTDTYGDFCRQGSSALSGKDVTRIDRIGVYAARHAAKNVVAAGLADECELQLSFSVGLDQPISVEIDTFGTGRVADERITGALKTHFDFRPAAIAQRFGLARLPADHHGVFYRRLAAFGHLGRAELDLPWERLDLVGRLSAALD